MKRSIVIGPACGEDVSKQATEVTPNNGGRHANIRAFIQASALERRNWRAATGTFG